jgi:N-acetylmuramoyl-L-alanine amidase
MGRRRVLIAGDRPPSLVMTSRDARDAGTTLLGERLSGTDAIVAPDSSVVSPVPERYLRDPLHWATDVPARWLVDSLALLVARGADTLRFPLALADTLGPLGLGWAMLGPDTTAVSDTDRTVYGRPVPGGTYRWFFLPGTAVRATGARDGFVRVALDSKLEVWVARGDVRFFPDGYAEPRRVVPNLRVVPAEDWVDVRFPVGERPPFQVEVEERALVLTLYGVTANSDIIQFLANDSLITHITWAQETTDCARYTLHLREPPYGWLAMWDRGSFVLRVRRPPAIDPVRPLAGLRIVVDAGHPPAGATGPTGLYEAVPVLAIARHLRRILEERGATAIMTRSTDDTLGLADRPIMARQANAHAFVSVHLNALPDGVNPFTAHGTGTYYFHPPSVPLAREVQRGMVHWMGLRDLGVYYDNLAVVRQTWMPSVLCEGAFIMLPEQEYAVRTDEFQERYALGVADGLERYFRRLRAGAWR